MAPLPRWQVLVPDPKPLFSDKDLPMKPERISHYRYETLHPAHPRIELRKGEEIDSVKLKTREYGTDQNTFEVVFEVVIMVPKKRPEPEEED